jgi:hypothetical protein
MRTRVPTPHTRSASGQTGCTNTAHAKEQIRLCRGNGLANPGGQPSETPHHIRFTGRTFNLDQFTTFEKIESPILPWRTEDRELLNLRMAQSSFHHIQKHDRATRHRCALLPALQWQCASMIESSSSIGAH